MPVLQSVPSVTSPLIENDVPHSLEAPFEGGTTTAAVLAETSAPVPSLAVIPVTPATWPTTAWERVAADLAPVLTGKE